MKPLSEMTAGEINREIAKVDARSSKNAKAFIDAGRGHETPSVYMKLTDPLALEAQEIYYLRAALIAEVQSECGPGVYEFPEGWRRRSRKSKGIRS